MQREVLEKNRSCSYYLARLDCTTVVAAFYFRGPVTLLVSSGSETLHHTLHGQSLEVDSSHAYDPLTLSRAQATKSTSVRGICATVLESHAASLPIV